ncbi:hypothetical protein ACVIVD_007966 [Bradyrhizobium liaoningense]
MSSPPGLHIRNAALAVATSVTGLPGLRPCHDCGAARARAARSLCQRITAHYSAAGPAALQGADATHAWVSLWCGAELGWIDLDPANDLLIGNDHVVLATRRATSRGSTASSSARPSRSSASPSTCCWWSRACANKRRLTHAKRKSAIPNFIGSSWPNRTCGAVSVEFRQGQVALIGFWQLRKLLLPVRRPEAAVQSCALRVRRRWLPQIWIELVHGEP